MADKKRKQNEKIDSFARYVARTQVPQTDDVILDRVMQETLESVVKAECYPQDKNLTDPDGEDDTQIYYCQRNTERYEQDPYTVAQHMQDRTQFRH
ncbi:MAG: hypothetical protein IKV52_04515 [Oscillospiraceae bacterium]|nr:hypothetical protein [Oscillospiraceae bacterium]